MNTPENPAPQPAAAQSAGTDAQRQEDTFAFCEAMNDPNIGFGGVWEAALKHARKPRPGPIGREPHAAGGLRELIEQLRRQHEVVEDCWYSCPKSGDCCDDNAGDKCNCGADDHNANIDEILALLAPPAPVGDAGAEDSARIEWLENGGHAFGTRWAGSAHAREVGRAESFEAPTVRQAIDAARAATRPHGLPPRTGEKS